MATSTTPIADLVISGATVVTGTATFEGSVAIKDGRIMALGEARAMPAARETFDAAGLHLLPSMIDVQCNFGSSATARDWSVGPPDPTLAQARA